MSKNELMNLRIDKPIFKTDDRVRYINYCLNDNFAMYCSREGFNCFIDFLFMDNKLKKIIFNAETTFFDSKDYHYINKQYIEAFKQNPVEKVLKYCYWDKQMAKLDFKSENDKKTISVTYHEGSTLP